LSDFFLDTDTCAFALGGRYPAIEERIRAARPALIRIPAMVRAELILAAEKSNRREDTLRKVRAFLDPYKTVAFGKRAADVYAVVRAALERRGTPIGPNDLIIASTVLARGGTLVTHDVREFRRVDGLRIEDWTE
jgi:tRNA(fMet)-specific endonuclease VapC